MQIVDSHVHIWTHDPRYPWAAEEEDIPAWNARAEDLIDTLKQHGVARAVLVQYIKYRWDNRYTAHALRAYPSWFRGVCRVDPRDPGSPDHLSYWTEQHGFRGVRLSPEADARGDWFEGPLMPPLFRRAEALRVPVLLLLGPSRLAGVARIFEYAPGAAIIIDHLAGCLQQDGLQLHRLLDLARFPGVYLKLGHIAQNSTQGFPWRDTHAFLEKIFQTFGARRIMWGSDWPFALKHMTYAQSLAYIASKNHLEEVQFLSQEEREWAAGKTASQFW